MLALSSIESCMHREKAEEYLKDAQGLLAPIVAKHSSSGCSSDAFLVEAILCINGALSKHYGKEECFLMNVAGMTRRLGSMPEESRRGGVYDMMLDMGRLNDDAIQ